MRSNLSEFTSKDSHFYYDMPYECSYIQTGTCLCHLNEGEIRQSIKSFRQATISALHLSKWSWERSKFPLHSLLQKQDLLTKNKAGAHSSFYRKAALHDYTVLCIHKAMLKQNANTHFCSSVMLGETANEASKVFQTLNKTYMKMSFWMRMLICLVRTLFSFTPTSMWAPIP